MLYSDHDIAQQMFYFGQNYQNHQVRFVQSEHKREIVKFEVVLTKEHAYYILTGCVVFDKILDNGILFWQI